MIHLNVCTFRSTALKSLELQKWVEWWPDADPDLVEHLMSVLIAFDTATAFAMSFGIAKFALAQEEAKLVGEIVGRYEESRIQIL